MELMCPLRYMMRNYPVECVENECAWWCAQSKCCAMAAIANRNESNFTSIMDSEINRRFGKQVD